MIHPKFFFDILKSKDINFFTGVPDSLLKSICAYISDKTSVSNHIITANEGNALALGMGYFLSTKKVPLIYMQNSGLGNIVNPLLSLSDSQVYSIPSLLMIGWRGEPGVKDEPQHITQGKLTLPLLDVLKIPYVIISSEMKNTEVENNISKAITHAKKNNHAYAIVVKKNTFEPYSLQKVHKKQYVLLKEEAISVIANTLCDKDIVVSTTGTASRELFEVRNRSSLKHISGNHRDFLTVGGMGHANHIALGIALQKPERNVFCLDGDGALLMHMGSLAIVANAQCGNLKHVVLNNGCHDSVGGQKSLGQNIDIVKIAKAMGYKKVYRAYTVSQVKKYIKKLQQNKETSLLEVMLQAGWRDSLGRPNKSPIENKKDFMEFVMSDII